jgi:serine phosphatase RsbU (regulator of sigma subunit)/putative methionine-R-sulfoxide reductase with GAF domain
LANQKSAGTIPDLQPEHILSLGDRLASITDYPEQKQLLESFLQEHFGGQATIWLKNPHKSIRKRLPKVSFPFDPGAKSEHEQPEDRELLTRHLENIHWAIIPLQHGKAEFGKILLHREQPFEHNELKTLLNISKVASLAVYATLQSHIDEWRQRQLTLVRSVTAQVSQITDLNILTKEISERIQQTFNFYYVAVFLIQGSGERLHFKASAGADKSDRPEFEHESHPGYDLGEHMIGYVAQTGSELIANDVEKEPRYHQVDNLAATKSEVVLPISIENRPLGVLDIQADIKHAFDEDDLLVLRALADSIAIAIESASLYQGIHKQAEQLAVVSEVSRSITSILDVDELLKQIVNLIHDRFSFPFVHLYTVDTVHQLISFKAGSGKRTPLYEKLGIAYDIHAEQGILSWVVQHGLTMRVNDVRKESRYLKAPIDHAMQGSEMAIPLIFGDEIIGVLDLQSDQIDAFTLEDQQLMETLADNIAIAIRNARLYRSEKWRRQVAESLRDVAGLLSENVALEDVLDAILDQLHKNLPCDIAGIWLFDYNSPDQEPSKKYQLYLAAIKTIHNYPSDILRSLTHAPDSWMQAALLDKQPRIRQPDDIIGPIAQLYNLPSNYSAIAAPLSTGDEVLGLLTLIHHSPGRYGYESQSITSAFASYAAIAIKNTRLFATSQEQAWISTILLQVAQAIQSLTNLDELTSTIVRLTPMVVGVKGCALLLREPESDIFSLSAMYGMGSLGEDLKPNQPLMLKGAPILEEILMHQEPVQVQDPQRELNFPEDFAEKLSTDSLILIPLTSRNEVLGAFLLANDARDNQNDQFSNILSEERYRIVQGIMQQTAIAIENIRLIESRQEEAYVSAVLLQAAQAAVSSENLQDTLDSMVNIMPILVGIDSSVIYLWDEDEQCFITSHATTKSTAETQALIATTFKPGDFPMLDVIFRHNRPTVYPFVETTFPPEDWDLALPDEGQIDPTPVLQTHYPLLMGFPLSVKDDVYGVLLAQDENYATNRERRFELLWGIAQQASLAIQNDLLNKEMLDRQRLEREFQLAREIQQTFLPDQIPETPGWEIDVRWETARQVGGDFYDYFLLPDGQLGFVIADVSDKGLAASLYMTVTRTLIRSTALEYNSPARTLERVNELLLINSQDGMFVTTFYGILSLEDGQLVYTIAGHNPPLVIHHQTREVIAMQKGGIALGAMPDIHLGQQKTTLNPGDCLVLYTDGVSEAFNLKDQMYGEGRLQRVLQTTVGKRASEVLEILEADLIEFRDGAPLSDDTTILAICRSKLLGDNHRDVSSS